MDTKKLAMSSLIVGAIYDDIALTFDEAHLENAIHLNFSDFAEQKLAKVIPNKSTRILIYCNNNFEEARIAALPQNQRSSL